jgi:hypothetical protein
MSATRDQLERLRGISDAQSVEHLKALQALIPELEPATCGPEEFEALLGVLERAPLDDGFESYWSIVHFLEACEGYEPSLLASIGRQPTELSLAMVNRMLNAGIEAYGDQALLDVLIKVAQRPELDERLRIVACGFVEHQRVKHDV